jgi:uncharacterized delta-60 repeat protein
MRVPRSVGSGAVVLATLLVGVLFAAAAQAAPADLDPTFSGDGMQTTDFGGGSDLAGVESLKGKGNIVAVGQSSAGNYDFALARYNPNGSLDPTFSGDGKQKTNFGSDDVATAVAIQSNGKIVVAGYAGGSFALARYNPNGALDPTFSGDGKLTTDFGGGFDGARGVALQGDGKIVAAGCACPNDVNARDFALARYNPNGALDPTFSGDGKLTTDFGASDDAADAVALQTDGKIVAVGHGGPGGDFALARYLGG